jgi:hypothetical protein
MNHDEQAGSPDLQAGLNALACPEIGVKWFLFLFLDLGGSFGLRMFYIWFHTRI